MREYISSQGVRKEGFRKEINSREAVLSGGFQKSFSEVVTFGPSLTVGLFNAEDMEKGVLRREALDHYEKCLDFGPVGRVQISASPLWGSMRSGLVSLKACFSAEWRWLLSQGLGGEFSMESVHEMPACGVWPPRTHSVNILFPLPLQDGA